MAVPEEMLVFALVFSVAFYNTSGKLYTAFNQYNGPPIDKIAAKNAQRPVWKTMQQRVDNFNPTGTAVWEMRYLENDQFYKNGGPIFIFLGGEWQINEGFLMQGQMYRMCEEHQGMMYYTEHRYYGKSIPTPDFSTENLKFLSSDQALEDLAKFIAARKEELFLKNNETDKCQNKVVVVGGSYSASLATWVRLKYPHLIQAAWASSGPLRAVADFFEYLEVVSENLGLANQQCVNVIEEATSQIEKLIETSSGAETISNLYGTCNTINFNHPQERPSFFSNIASYFSAKVQYAKPGDLTTVCKKLLTMEGESYEKLGALIRNESDGCISTYKEVIEIMRNIRLADDGPRPWAYQTCTEFGFFQTSNSTKQPLGKNFMVDFYENFCVDIFGNNFNGAVLDKDISRTNIVYGSTKPDIRRVVTIHGSVDPWHKLGVLEDLNNEAPAMLVQGTSHCMDLAPSKAVDLPQLINARNRAKNLISKWLQ